MKLHLPKRLFTALLTAITLAAAPAALTLGSAAWGEEESSSESIASTVDYTVYNIVPEAIKVYQWTGNSSKNGSICYGLWYEMSYNGTEWETGTSVGASGSSTGYLNYVNRGHYLLFDENSTDGNSSGGAVGEARFDTADVSFAGLIVKSDSSVTSLSGELSTGNNGTGTTSSERSITLGRSDSTEQAPTYSVIEKDFTLTNADSTKDVTSFILQEHQQWEVAQGATFSLETRSGQSISQTGNLTIKGAGAVKFLSNLYSTGSVIVGSGASLNLSGGYTQAAGASLTVNGSLTLGGSVVLHDAITANGAVTLGSGVVFDLAHLTAGEDNCYTLFTGADSISFSDVSFTNGRGGWSYTMQSNGIALATFDGKTVTWHGDNESTTIFEWCEGTTFADDAAFKTYDNVNITGSDAIKLTSGITASQVTIGAAEEGADITVTFTSDSNSNVLKVQDGFVIRDGATVVVDKQTDSVGFIQGEVTIENGGVLKFNKKDVTGYNGGATSMHTINVQAGGELQLALSGNSNNETFAGTLNLDGTLKGLVNGSASTWDLFAKNNNKGTIVVSDGASADIDNVNIRLRQDNSVITVGSEASLSISGTITKWTEGNGILYKEGAGAMTVGGAVTVPKIFLNAGSLTFNDTATLTNMDMAAATQLSFAGTGKNHSITETLYVGGKNSSISIAEGSSLTVGTINVSWMMSGLTVNGILEATTEMIIGSGYGDSNAWKDKFTGTGQVVTKKLTTNNGSTISIGVNSLTIGDDGLSVSEGSTLTLKSLTTAIEGATNVNADTHLELASGNVTMNGALTSTGTLTIESGAKLELNGANNTVSGTFTVENGAAITLGTGAVLDLTGMNIRNIFESVIKATDGAGLVKFQGIDAFPSNDDNEVAWRVSATAALTLNTDVTVEKSVAINMGASNAGKTFDVNGKTLTVGGDLRFETGAKLQVGSGAVDVTGSLLLGHQTTGHAGHIELSGGKITTSTIRRTNVNDNNISSLTMSGGELELTQDGAVISGINTVISGGTLIANTASWGIDGTGVGSSTLGNVSFDIAEGQSITLSGAMSLTGTLTHSGEGKLVFNTTQLSMSQEALNSLRITTTEVATGENGLSYLQYHLVNATAGGTMSGSATSVQVGDASLAFDAKTGIISSAEQTFVINGEYSTSAEDAVANLTNASLGIVVGETGQFTIAGNVSDDLTVQSLLSSTAGAGTLVLTASGVVLNKENGLSNFHGKLQVGEGNSLEINDQNNFLNLTNLQEIELLAGATMDVRYGTGIKANTIKMNVGSRLQLHNGGGNYNTLEANLLIAGDATLDTSTYGDKTQVLGTISGNGTLSIEKESNNTWVLASTITDGTGAGDALALHFTDAPSGNKFVHITGDNSYSGGTTIDVGNIKTGHVNALGTGNVTLGESAALILESDLNIQGALNSAGAITIGANTTLTLGGGTAEAQKQHSIGTLTGSTGSMLNLAQHSVLNKVNTINGTVTLAGSGKYDLGEITTQWTEKDNAASILGVTLAGDWTGVVKVSGNTSSGDNDVNGAKLNVLANENSWVELDSVVGWLFNVDGTGSSYDHAANLILSGTGLTINASSQRTYIFSKSIKGMGNFTLATSSGDPLSYNFTGNISEWAGAFVVNANGSATPTTTLNLTGGGNLFSGAEGSGVVMNRGGVLNVNIGKADADTTMRGSIGFGEVKTGTLNLTVQGDTAFQKSVEASQMTVNSGKTATLNADSTVGTMAAGSGSVTLGDSVTLTLGGGTADVQKQHSIGTLTGGTGSMLNLAQHSVLNTITITPDSGVTLTGSGTYKLASGTSTMTSGMTLGEDWTGAVRLSGSFSGLNLNDCTSLYNEDSWIEFAGVSGYMAMGQEVSFGANIRLTDIGGTPAINHDNGGNGDIRTFTGKIEGTGTWKRTRTNGTVQSYVFAGDVSGWTGAFVNAIGASHSGNATATNLTFQGASAINVDISNPGAGAGNVGALNVTINDAAQGENKSAVAVNGSIQATKLTVDTAVSADFSNTVDVDTLVVNSGKTATFNNTATADTVELGEAATITGKQDGPATMSKVKMSSTGITGTAQDGSSSMSNADIEVLAQDATFTIADMTLTNTSINAATVNTQVSFDNVTVSGAVVLKNLKVAMSDAQVGAGGSEGSIGKFTGSTTLLSGITMSADSSLTVDLGDLSSYAAMGPGKYDLSITLSGFSMDAYTGDYAGSALQFAADSWLGELLAQGNNANVQISISQAKEGAAAAAAGVSSGSTGVSYSTGNVGMVITITGLNVPEPTTATLSLLALAALAGRRRRK